MEQIIITKKFPTQTLFNRTGFNEEASGEMFIALLKEAWRRRAKRDWPGAMVYVRLTLEPGCHSEQPLDIWGTNAAGEQEDLDWQIPDYEGDALKLYEQFHAWAVPLLEE